MHRAEPRIMMDVKNRNPRPDLAAFNRSFLLSVGTRKGGNSWRAGIDLAFVRLCVGVLLRKRKREDIQLGATKNRWCAREKSFSLFPCGGSLLGKLIFGVCMSVCGGLGAG